MKSVVLISAKEVKDYHAKSNWIMDGCNSDCYWNIDFGRPRPVEMGPGNWLHRGWFISHREKVMLSI